MSSLSQTQPSRRPNSNEAEVWLSLELLTDDGMGCLRGSDWLCCLTARDVMCCSAHPPLPAPAPAAAAAAAPPPIPVPMCAPHRRRSVPFPSVIRSPFLSLPSVPISHCPLFFDCLTPRHLCCSLWTEKESNYWWT